MPRQRVARAVLRGNRGSPAVTLRTEKVRPARVDPTDRMIVNLLRGGEGCGAREIAEGIGLSTRSARRRLARLVERGLVCVVGARLTLGHAGTLSDEIHKKEDAVLYSPLYSL